MKGIFHFKREDYLVLILLVLLAFCFVKAAIGWRQEYQKHWLENACRSNYYMQRDRYILDDLSPCAPFYERNYFYSRTGAAQAYYPDEILTCVRLQKTDVTLLC